MSSKRQKMDLFFSSIGVNDEFKQKPQVIFDRAGPDSVQLTSQLVAPQGLLKRIIGKPIQSTLHQQTHSGLCPEFSPQRTGKCTGPYQRPHEPIFAMRSAVLPRSTLPDTYAARAFETAEMSVARFRSTMRL